MNTKLKKMNVSITDRVVPVSISMPLSLVAQLQNYGNGNLSENVRNLCSQGLSQNQAGH